MDAKAQDEGFRETLRTMALFWRYSPFNQFLIHIQRPDATRITVRRKWEAMGRRIPTLDATVRGRSRLWRALEQAARVLGVQVGYGPLPDRMRGRSLGGRIEVAPGLPGQLRTSVLAHELAHEILHQAEVKRAAELQRPGRSRTHAERETEAEATAFVVLPALGLPSKAPADIAWQGGTGLAVVRSMTRVQR